MEEIFNLKVNGVEYPSPLELDSNEFEITEEVENFGEGTTIQVPVYKIKLNGSLKYKIHAGPGVVVVYKTP